MILLLATFLGGSITAWWNSPALIEYALRTGLTSNGFTLSAFSMARPYNWLVLIERIRIVSPSVLIRLSGMEITPMSAIGLENVLTINEASFQVTRDGSDTPLNWRTLIESINDNILLLPLVGEIEQLQFCIQECFDGSLYWRRHGGRVEVEFLIATAEVSGSLSWVQDKSTIFVTGTNVEDNRFLLEVDLTPDSRNINIDGRAGFLAGSQTLNLHGDSPFQYDLDMDSFDVSFSGLFPLDGIVGIDNIMGQLQASLTVGAQASLLVQTDRINLSSRQWLSTDVEIEQGIIKPRLSGPLEIAIQTPATKQMTLTIDTGAQCQIDKNIDCKGPSASLFGYLDSYDVFAALSAIQFSLADGHSKLSTIVALDLAEDDTPLVTAELALTVRDTDVSASARTANLLGLDADRVEIEHNLESALGRIAVNLTSPAEKIQRVINYLEIQDLNVADGELILQSNIAWDLGRDDFVTAFDATVSATALEVTYGSYNLHGGEFELQLSGWPTISSVRPANMSWQQFDVGVPIEDLRLQFNLSLAPLMPVFAISGNRMDATVFDGQLSSVDYDYEITSATGHINLSLTELDLNQILALQEDEFESTGKISGSVPVHINKGILEVSKGTITAIEPGGFIKYRPSPSVMNLVAQNEQLKVVVDTMSDFQYHSLEAALTYSPEGDMVATTALKGSNPAFDNGREIHLNVRIEENLATLLKSLRLSDRLTKKISAKAKSGVR